MYLVDKTGSYFSQIKLYKLYLELLSGNNYSEVEFLFCKIWQRKVLNCMWHMQPNNYYFFFI